MNCIFQFLINVLVSVIMCQYVILYDLLRALTWVGCFGRTHHANRLLCRFRTAERLECGPGLTTKWSRPQNKRQEHGVETWRHCRQDGSTPETERKMREVHRRGAKEWEEKKSFSSSSWEILSVWWQWWLSLCEPRNMVRQCNCWLAHTAIMHPAAISHTAGQARDLGLLRAIMAAAAVVSALYCHQATPRPSTSTQSHHAVPYMSTDRSLSSTAIPLSPSTRTACSQSHPL